MRQLSRCYGNLLTDTYIRYLKTNIQRLFSKSRALKRTNSCAGNPRRPTSPVTLPLLVTSSRQSPWLQSQPDTNLDTWEVASLDDRCRKTSNRRESETKVKQNCESNEEEVLLRLTTPREIASKIEKNNGRRVDHLIVPVRHHLL